MSNFSSLKTTIQQYIKTNGNEEITGAVLQDILLSMVSVMGDAAINDLESALQTETTNRTNADGTLQQNINNEATARGNADTALGNRLTAVEGSITTINTMLGEGYVYAGLATTSTNPGTPTGKVFYIATVAGTYTNFLDGSSQALVLTRGINILKFNGTVWSQEQVIAIDDVPTAGSDNLVKSGGVFNAMSFSNVNNGLKNAFPGYIFVDNNTVVNKSSYKSLSLAFPCTNGQVYLYTGYSGLAVAGCIFYDLNGDIIGNFAPSSFDLHKDLEITIPNGCRYVRFLSSKPNSYTDVDWLLDAKLKNKYSIISSKEYNGYLMSDDTYGDTQNKHSLTTSKISCAEGDVFYYKGRGINLARSYIMYNGSTIVSYGSVNNKDSDGLYYRITIPTGVTHIKFSSYEDKSNPNIILDVLREAYAAIGSLSGTSEPLYQKKINWLGDSYVANHTQSYDLTWEHLLSQKYDMTDRNYGINGNGIIAGDNPMQTRYVNMNADADYVIVIGGTNDFNAQIAISSFKTQLSTFIENLVAMYPNSKIAFFTPWNSDPLPYGSTTPGQYSLRDYANAIEEVCLSKGVPCFNSAKRGDMYPWNAGFRTNYYQGADDVSHLNSEGHKRFMSIAEKFLLSI